MNIINDALIAKTVKKKIGNKKLKKQVEKFIEDYEKENFKNVEEVKQVRKNLDNVYKNKYFFDDIDTYRCLLEINFIRNFVYIHWFGTHQEYEREYKNNKNTIASVIQKRYEL